LLQIVVFTSAAGTFPFVPDGHWAQLAIGAACLLALLAIISTMITFISEQNDERSLDGTVQSCQQNLPIGMRRRRKLPRYALQIAIAVAVWLLFSIYDPFREVAPDAPSTITAIGAAVIAAVAVSVALQIRRALLGRRSPPPDLRSRE
jgi:hypothetical protein